MDIIMSHNNLDFDALASMIAAKKLYPNATPVLPSRITSEVEHFITIYKNVFPFLRIHECSLESVEKIILVDTAFIDEQLPDNMHHLPLIIHDHHELDHPPAAEFYECEAVGATITLLTERIQAESIEVTPLEATVFALGVYSDTASFTLSTTTGRDLQAAAYLLECGANLKVVEQFREVPLTSDQQQLFQQLLEQGEISMIHGIEVMICVHEQEHYTGHLAHITRKLLQISGIDGVISLVRMGNKTFVTSRAQTELIDYRPMMSVLGGGGHAQAASASLKNKPVEEVYETIQSHLAESILPALRAVDLMTSPVRVIAPETDVETASKMLYRYGHSGFPVVKDEVLVGVISRRDIDKALHHQLGHAPVKGFMKHHPVWIDEEARLETIRNLMMEEQIGRLPVLRSGRVVGIVSRTDLIQAMHGSPPVKNSSSNGRPVKRQVNKTMQHTLAPSVLYLLQLVQKQIDQNNLRAYLIGGIVRDMFLEIPNKDIDIVIEGDAVSLAEALQEAYGGRVRAHNLFRTASWMHPSGAKVDFSSARTEYYDFPAALPRVEPSSLKEDLYRRDFTVNALAVSINSDTYGELTDFFHGLEDIYTKRLRVLYNLSFVEDPTRILRAIRFESRFGFRMDEQTKFLAYENRHLLRSVSHFRLADELSRLYVHSDPRDGTSRLLAFEIEQDLFEDSVEQSEIKQRVRKLLMYEKLFSAEEPSFRRNWITYLLQFIPAKSSSVIELKKFSLNKEEKKFLDTCLLWLEQDKLTLWESADIQKLHQELHLAAQETVTAFAAAFASKNCRRSLMRYLYRRAAIQDWVTGKDLINAGEKPGTHFTAMLFEAELIKLKAPDMEKEEIIQLIKSGKGWE